MQAIHQTRTLGARLARLVGLALAGWVLMTWLPIAQAADINDSKLTTAERLELFEQVGADQKVILLPKIYQPDPKSDIVRYKIPDFLNKVVKNENEDPRVRQEALAGMVQLIQKEDSTLRGQFIPVLNEVLGGKSSTLVQEYILEAAPTMVDPTGPGPNKLLQEKIISMAENNKLETDNELRLRCQAILALGRIGNSEHLEKFFKLMSDPNKAIPPFAIEAVNLYLRSANTKDLELKPQHLAILLNLLKDKATPYEGKVPILRVLGVNARNFRKTHANTQIAPGVLEGMQEIKRLLTTEANPPYFLIGACIEALGMFAQQDSVSLISQILVLPYMKTAEAMPYRVSSVEVLDQAIVANIGDGKTASKVVEDAATVLTALLTDAKEESAVRMKAAFYLADVRFASYPRDKYFMALFDMAFGAGADTSLTAVCKKSMEVLAGRTFPSDWTLAEFQAWWKKEGELNLKKKS